MLLGELPTASEATLRAVILFSSVRSVSQCVTTVVGVIPCVKKKQTNKEKCNPCFLFRVPTSAISKYFSRVYRINTILIEKLDRQSSRKDDLSWNKTLINKVEKSRLEKLVGNYLYFEVYL